MNIFDNNRLNAGVVFGQEGGFLAETFLCSVCMFSHAVYV